MRKHGWLRLFGFASIGVALLMKPGVGQQSNASTPVAAWAQMAAGFSTGEDNAGFMLGASIQARSHVVSVRSAGTWGLFDDNFWDFGVLYGLGTVTAESRISASTGVAVVNGQRCSGLFDPCEDINSTIGLPLAVDVSWIGLKYLGLGLHGFANLNSEQSFAGIGVTVQVGKLR